MLDNPVLQQVRKDICDYGLIEPGFHVVTGISGGADSVCLLKVMKELGREYNLSITAVHVNHMLRGTESDADEAFVMDLCRKWDIPVRAFRADIAGISRTDGLTEEEAGREVRYRYLFQVLRESSADVIATGHHYEDNAETVMLNILRGCGLEGLAGMDYRSGSIIRPLLGVRRSQIEDYLRCEGIPWRTDSSNLSNKYARNRVRNLLFPAIKEHFQVDPAPVINRLSALARRDNACLEEQARKVFMEFGRKMDTGTSLDAEVLVSLDYAISSRIVRMAWEQATGSLKGLENVHVDEIIKLCRESGTGKRLCLPGGWSALLSYGRLLLSPMPAAERVFWSYPVNVPGKVHVNEAHGILEAYVLSKDQMTRQFPNWQEIKETSKTQAFDYLKINCGINIRNRRDGDRIRPFRAPGEKKLKKFFIDNKIPAEIRDEIPLVAAGSKILWVVGMRTSGEFRPDERTQSFLVLTWIDINDGGDKK
ncbi:MAG: tRNA lysidine(34) synthetase TilS [Clostridiaceae bacterium]|nr:tRNA lysidine(34) synthetase TilS [Clostridiaceae bacterium]